MHVKYLLTIDSQVSIGPDWGVSPARPDLALIFCIVLHTRVAHLQIVGAERVVPKDWVTIKPGEETVITWKVSGNRLINPNKKTKEVSNLPRVNPSFVHWTWPIWFPTWHRRTAVSPSVTSVSWGVLRKCWSWHSARPTKDMAGLQKLLRSKQTTLCKTVHTKH